MWTQLGGAIPERLLGRPAVESSYLDGTISGGSDNFILILGDFSNYVIADRIGMTVEFIPHLVHTTSHRPSGQRGIFAFFRSGADSVNDSAFALLNST